MELVSIKIGPLDMAKSLKVNLKTMKDLESLTSKGRFIVLLIKYIQNLTALGRG